MLIATLPSLASADDGRVLRSGLYEIEYRLELPHLERYAIVRSATFCIDMRKRSSGPPIPVVGANNAFHKCAVENLVRRHSRVTYDIRCSGRDAARASAAYRLAQNGFNGRVAIVMGAKNMTMTEVQEGRRLGNCKLAAQ